MKRVLVMPLVSLLLAMPAVGLADDVQPPSWRGQISTTSQMWEFQAPLQPPVTLLPDGPAPGGQPPLPSTNAWIAGNDWLQSDPRTSD